MNPEQILSRIFEYAQKTGIDFHSCGRFSGWKKYHLPDTRGFTPHLRRVNIFEDYSLNTQTPFTEEDLWLAHDVSHIMFYDFATLQLGDDLWNDPDRFLECHLASEAFAVLLLDYWTLIFTSHKGLAVDLDGFAWKNFQKLNPKLPDLKTVLWVKELAELYLTGNSEAFSQEIKPTPVYQNWLGHEVRYSDKQRWYVTLWLDDLLGKSVTSNKRAILENSFVYEGIYSLIEIVTGDSNSWSDYLGNYASLQTPNYFNALSKYQSLSKQLDFRFSDHCGFDKQQIQKILEESSQPSPSSLFLFWQIISSSKPEQIKDLSLISELAQQSQITNSPMPQWSKVQQLCLNLIKDRNWMEDPLKVGTFFLP